MPPNSPTTTVTIDTDKGVTANFDVSYELTTDSTEGGTVTVPGEGIIISDEWFLNTGAYVTYRAARAWDFTLGYTYSVSKIDTDTYYNKAIYSTASLSVTRFW